MKTFPYQLSPYIKICTQAIFVMAMLTACKKHKQEARPVVSSVAGNGAFGYVDGPASNAQFYDPTGVAIDGQGNVYVADFRNQCIRKITPAGIVSTLAGNGTIGFVDGAGAGARFYHPYGVACDAQGNIYVADLSNSAIRKVTPSGVVSTLAGTGAIGHADGPGSSATFSAPTDVACDAQGNVYVADQGQNLIRKITPAGIVSTLAGMANTPGNTDGVGTAARFFGPFALTCDRDGNLYVADRNNHRIRKITQSGVVTTLAGGVVGGVDGTGSAASFNAPSGIACDSHGNIFVADTYNDKIRKITPAGVVTTFAGSSTGYLDGEPLQAQFSYPYGICFDEHDNLYIADYANQKIRKISLQ